MPRPAYRLTRWHWILLNGVSALLILTGTAWLALHYTAGSRVEGLPHPLEVWVIRLHGIGAFGGLFVLGILAAAHAPHGWRATARDRRRTQRRTGLGLCVLAAALVVSGYLLYYFAPETVRPTLGWVHSIIGVAMLALGLSHARRSRR